MSQQEQLTIACRMALDSHNCLSNVRALGVEPRWSADRLTGIVFIYHEHRVSVRNVPMDDPGRQAAWFAFFRVIEFGTELYFPEEETLVFNAAVFTCDADRMRYAVEVRGHVVLEPSTLKEASEFCAMHNDRLLGVESA